MTRIAAIALFGALAGYWIYAAAQSRIDVRPVVAPIGTSSSDGVSFAWFYDAANRIVYVCRTGKGATQEVDCRAKSTLP